MPIIESHKLVFQHIPKTGGTAICRHFEVETVGHQHLNWYDKEIKDRGLLGWPADWVTFCVIRNPVERFVSAWQMIKNLKDSKTIDEDLLKLKREYSSLFSHDTIDKFTEGLTNQSVGTKFFNDLNTYHFWGITSFVSSAKEGLGEGVFANPSGDDIVVHKPAMVLLYDQLDKDFETLSKVCGFKNKGLSNINTGREKSKTMIKNMSNETLEIISHIYKLDFEVGNMLLKERHVSLYV